MVKSPGPAWSQQSGACAARSRRLRGEVSWTLAVTAELRLRGAEASPAWGSLRDLPGHSGAAPARRGVFACVAKSLGPARSQQSSACAARWRRLRGEVVSVDQAMSQDLRGQSGAAEASPIRGDVVPDRDDHASTFRRSFRGECSVGVSDRDEG